ncbi:MAG: branched-chain alpha-keto acid dehydrogenase subunit E2 [Roseobacter sp. MedPE-SW]|nr:MAG: branched-chain alpha-keto acid dehydrogenase subunit E2 [Roseobacter sp. MedPE-SW]
MSDIIELRVPNIGDVSDVPVIEMPLIVGDHIDLDDTVLVLESDKATLDVPATSSGKLLEVLIREGDTVSEGDIIGRVEVIGKAEGPAPEASSVQIPSPAANPTEAVARAAAGTVDAGQASTSGILPSRLPEGPQSTHMVHASPSLRKLARELGLDISQVTGTGPKSRITREDVTAHIKKALQTPTLATGFRLDLPAWPDVDPAKFGHVSRTKLSRIARISGPSLARNAITIPHVTNFENADVTDLESFRKSVNSEGQGAKLTLLAFVVKAVVAALKAHPKFNASLDGEDLVLKEYFNIGVAADTPDGLVVPVIKAADQKSLRDIAVEMADLAADARDGRIKPADMQGGSFTISSLGGIGGTNFTPIINAPEVAILGMVRSSMQPVWDGSAFQPRLIQPMSLSWDHRVVDGVAAARFLQTVQSILQDFRRISL